MGLAADDQQPVASIPRSMFAPVTSTVLSRRARYRSTCIGTRYFISKITNTPIAKATSVAPAETVTKSLAGARP